MTTLPQEFMANIIANREDNLPRLIAADWLDEHGESERAEFIRVQCELATRPPLVVFTNEANINCKNQKRTVEGHTLNRIGSLRGGQRVAWECPSGSGSLSGFGQVISTRHDLVWQRCHIRITGGDPELHNRRVLEKRVRDLLKSNAGGWTDFLPESLTTMPCRCNIEGVIDPETGVIECRKCDSTGVVFNHGNFGFRRGFVYEIATDWESWESNHEQITACTPLENVHFTTMPPDRWIGMSRQLWTNLRFNIIQEMTGIVSDDYATAMTLSRESAI